MINVTTVVVKDKMSELSKEDWLKTRKVYIGSSDISAICKKNRFASPLSVYNDKVSGVLEEKEIPAAIIGTVLEDYVFSLIDKKLGYPKGYVYKDDQMLSCKEYPYLSANLDGVDIEGNIYEVKVVQGMSSAGWAAGVPEYYVYQAHQQMLLTNSSVVYLSVLFYENWIMAMPGSSVKPEDALEIFAIQRDEKIIEEIISEGKKFWDMVENKTPPVGFASEIDTKELDTAVIIDEHIEELEKAVISAKNNEKIAKKEKELAAGKFKEAIMSLGKTFVSRVSDRKYYSFIGKDTVTFDAKRFKEENPELHKQYLKTKEGQLKFSDKKLTKKELKELTDEMFN